MAEEWPHVIVSGISSFSTYLKAALTKTLVNLGLDFSGESHFNCLLVLGSPAQEPLD